MCVAGFETLESPKEKLLNPQEFRKHVEDEIVKWRKVIQVTGVQTADK